MEPGNRGDSRLRSAAASSAEVHQGEPGDGFGGTSTDKQNDKRAMADSDLSKVIDAWADLPEPVKAGIVAMVGAAR